MCCFMLWHYARTHEHEAARRRPITLKYSFRICHRQSSAATVKPKCISKMEKAITAEQIADWFTSGASFASIKLTEEAVARRSPELLPTELR